jgi:hypothetical protein
MVRLHTAFVAKLLLTRHRPVAGVNLALWLSWRHFNLEALIYQGFQKTKGENSRNPPAAIRDRPLKKLLLYVHWNPLLLPLPSNRASGPPVSRKRKQAGFVEDANLCIRKKLQF